MTINQYAATLPVSDQFSSLINRRKRRATTPASPTPASSNPAYQSDPALIQACLSGDQTAWNTLVERYGRLVYSIARRCGLPTADADDVFQNVFTIAFRRLASLRNQTRLSAWLITTTHRECWRLYKVNAPQVELDEGIADADVSAVEQVQHWELQQAVHEAIGRLDARAQELLKALFFDSTAPSYEEIAQRLGMAVGSIGPTRARCFKKLESILVAMGVDSGH
ncbi:MAG TPA: sigma-70 family RNA polymerase sigma factor [Anaerolineae bacterium]|nr:sigma-70 family RNA polymerase sigma factor [Anaerolineae bacterium]